LTDPQSYPTHLLINSPSVKSSILWPQSTLSSFSSVYSCSGRFFMVWHCSVHQLLIKWDSVLSRASCWVWALLLLDFSVGVFLSLTFFLLPSSMTAFQFANHSWSTNYLLFSLIVTLLSAYFSDKYQNRSIPAILVVLLCVIGFAMNLRKSTIRNPLSPCARNFLRAKASLSLFPSIRSCADCEFCIFSFYKTHRHNRQICGIRLSLLYHTGHIRRSSYPLRMVGQ